MEAVVLITEANGSSIHYRKGEPCRPDLCRLLPLKSLFYEFHTITPIKSAINISIKTMLPPLALELHKSESRRRRFCILITFRFPEHLPVITDFFFSPLVVTGENVGGINSHLPFILGFVLARIENSVVASMELCEYTLVCTHKHMEPYRNHCCKMLF